MLRAALPATVVFVLLSAGAARAENAACWGDESRQDISCTAITERLLLDLRGQNEAVARKLMNAPGRTIENGLHFLSNYSRGKKAGSGDLNVIFENGRSVSIFAAVDRANSSGHQDFIWSVYAAPPLGQEIDRSTADFGRKPFCSDLSSKSTECSAQGGIDDELTKMQMQGNLSKSELLKALQAACRPTLGLSDPAGECDRLQRRFE